MCGVIWLGGISASCKAAGNRSVTFLSNRRQQTVRIYDACGVLAIRRNVEIALTRRIASASLERK